MRLDELLFEEPQVPGAGRRKIQMSMADLYDMTGQPYPLVRDKDSGQMVVPENFYQKREFAVGVPDADGNIPDGAISPELARGYDQWVAGGKMPGLLLDDAGEVRPYNDNWYLEDFAWRLASGTSELAANLSRGVASGVDGLWNLAGGKGKPVTKIARETWMDDAAEWLDNRTDLQFRDTGDMMANAVQTPGDLIGLIPGFGDTRSQMSWAGFGAMFATELPSTMLDLAIITGSSIAGGPLGTKVGTSILATMNAAEASGAAVKQISDVVDANYENGELQKTYQWSAATQLARAQLESDGVIVPGEELTDVQQGQLDELAKEVIMTNTYNAVLPAVAGSAAVLDTIGDKILFKPMTNPIKPSVIRNTMMKWLIAPQMEGVEEAFQEVWTQRGLVTEAGDLNDEFANAINAYYQGVVIGKGEAAFATATDTVIGLNKGQKAARAKLRTYFYGKDAGNLDTIIDLAGQEPTLLLNNILSEDGRLQLAQKYGEGVITDIDQLGPDGQPILSRGDRRRISRGRTITLPDGTELSRKIIEQNAKNVELLKIIDNMVYNPQENRYDVNFESEEQLLDAASLLGIDTEGRGIDFKGKRRINRVMKDFEEVLKLDARIIGRSNLEAPAWGDLTPVQKASYVNNGYIEFTHEDDGARIGQRWTRDQVDESSRRYGSWDTMPDEVKNAEMPTTARPTLEGDGNTVQRARQSAIDALASFKIRAERELEQKQTAWDRRYSDDPDNAPRPRPDETDADYQRLMMQANGQAGPGIALKQRVDQIDTDLREAQAAWDQEFGRTHNRNGTPKVQLAVPSANGNVIQNPKTVVDDGQPNDTGPEPTTTDEPDTTAVDNQDAADAEQDQDSADFGDEFDTTITPDDITGDDDAETEQEPTPAPVQAEPFSDVARSVVISNTMYRIASGDIRPEVVEGTLANLEKTYPGITKEILPNGIESFKANIELEQKTIADNAPAVMSTEPTRPQTGATVERDGVTYVYPGGMWIALKDDGSRGQPASKELQQELTATSLNTTVPALQAAREANEDERPAYTNPTRPDVMDQTVDMTKYEEGDVVEYRNAAGDVRSAEVVRPLDNGNLQVTLNGATYAITPANIAAAQIPAEQPPKTADNNFGMGVVDPGLQRAINQRAQNAVDAGGIDNLPVDDGTPNDTGPEPTVGPTTAEREAAQQIIANQAADAEERSVRDSIRDEARRIAAEREAEAQELAIRDSIRDQAAREAQRMNAAKEETANREVIQNIAKKIASDNNAAEQESEIRDQIIQRAEDLANQSKEFGDAAAEELAVRNSIRDAAKEAAEAAKAEAEETAQREAIRTAAEEKAAEIAAQNQLVDDNEQDIRDEIRRRAEEQANLAAERREAEIRKQIEDQIKSIEDAEAQQQAAQANDKDGDLTTPLDTTGETPPVPKERPAQPVPTPKPRPAAPATSSGRGDGDAEVARRRADQEAETKRLAALKQAEIMRKAQDRIRAADAQASQQQGDDSSETTPYTPDMPPEEIPDSKLDRRLIKGSNNELNTTNVNLDRNLPYVIQPVTGARDADGNVQVGKVYGTNDQLGKKYPGVKQYNSVTGSGRGDGNKEADARRAQREIDARNRAQQDIDVQQDVDDKQSQNDTSSDNTATTTPNTQVTPDTFTTNTEPQTGLQTPQTDTLSTVDPTTAVATAANINTNKNKKSDKQNDQRARIKAPFAPGDEPKKDLFNIPGFKTLSMPDPLNLDRYKSFGDSVQDHRKPVNEKQVKEYDDGIIRHAKKTGQYKAPVKKKTVAPTPTTNQPSFKTASMSDPMGLNRFKGFGENKNKGK